jgi:hypothetical protein
MYIPSPPWLNPGDNAWQLSAATLDSSRYRASPYSTEAW